MYKNWVTELIIDPHDKPKGEILQTHVASDHPLSQANDSTWNVYFKDKEMMFEIEKDVKKELSHICIFLIEMTVVVVNIMKLLKGFYSFMLN